MLRQPLLLLARSTTLKNLVSSMPVSSSIVNRYVPGESTESAVDATRALIDAGVRHVEYAVADPFAPAAGGHATLEAAGISTGAGLLACTANPDGSVTVDMGEPRLAWSEIPLSRSFPDTFSLDVAFDYGRKPGVVQPPELVAAAERVIRASKEAKLHILDTLGCAIAAADSPFASASLAALRRLDGGSGSVAIGQNAGVTGANSVALGAGALADRAWAVSVGSAGFERQIIHVADGTAPTDAVNLRQLEASLASANAYTDAQIAGLAPGGLSEPEVRVIADAGDATTLGAANDYTDSRETAIREDMSAGDAATLTSAQEHADAGDATTLDAAETHADAGDAATLATANAYTDAQIATLAGFDPSSLDGRLDALAEGALELGEDLDRDLGVGRTLEGALRVRCRQLLQEADPSRRRNNRPNKKNRIWKSHQSQVWKK